ncbi:Tn3 family transposase, partial [Legionella bozemanae]
NLTTLEHIAIPDESIYKFRSSRPYWNTMRMTEIITQLKNNGEVISDNTLTHISLLPHKHLITMGTYFTDAAIDQSEIEDVREFTVLEQI